MTTRQRQSQKQLHSRSRPTSSSSQIVANSLSTGRMSGLRQRQTMSSNAGNVQRVADYIKSEVVMPDGQPSGSVLRRADKQLGGVILAISQAIWFLAIAIGILFYQGTFHPAQYCPVYDIVRQICCKCKYTVPDCKHGC